MKDKGYKSRIDRLKRSLYSRKKFINSSTPRVFPFRKRNFDIKTDWDEVQGSASQEEAKLSKNESVNQEEPMKRKKKKISLINKVLITTLLFLIIAIGLAYFAVVGNGNNISSDNIDITLSGPILINAGEVLSFEIDIINKNNVDLETVDLLIEYPDGARDADNVKSTIKRYRKSLGEIKVGERVQEAVEVILFGEEGSIKEIIVGVEYRVSDSNAIFFTERKYEVEVNTSPVSVDVIAPREIGSGQEVEFNVEIRSNSERDLENIIIEAEYPFGFTFIESEPSAIGGDRTWKVEELKSGEKKIITIKGKIDGQDDDKRVFRFNVGLEDEKILDKIGVVFVSHSKSVLIKRSFINLNVVVNGSSKTGQIAGGGQQIRVDISWKNNLPVKIENGVVEVKLDGEIIDKTSVVSSNGFYKSSNNTIMWDKRSNSELGLIDVGRSGSMSFSFTVKEPFSIIANDIKNPEINIDTSFLGGRIDESTKNKKNISSNIKKNIKISAYTALSSKVVHFEGDFINTGPLPPKVDSETTYTIVMSLSNLINDVSGGVLKAVLPPYVRWMGVYNPTNESVSYNAIGGEIVWEVGDLYSGRGYSNPAREIQFQVALIPSLSLVGKTPKLVENITFFGVDLFTDAVINIEEPAATIRFNSDSNFKEEMSKVVQ